MVRVLVLSERSSSMVLVWLVGAAFAAYVFFRLDSWKCAVALVVFVVCCINVGIASGILHGFPWT
jgi:hypothetical protein